MPACWRPRSSRRPPPPPRSPRRPRWLVRNADTGEVLASSAAREHRAIASITKLMTVLVALDRLQPSDVVTVDARAAGGRAGEHLPPGRRADHRARARPGRADPVGQQRRGLARACDRARLRLVRRADERQGQGARHDGHELRPARRARRARRVLDRPRRDGARRSGRCACRSSARPCARAPR